MTQRLGLSEKDLLEARGLMAKVSVVPEALALAAQGVIAMHDVTRGSASLPLALCGLSGAPQCEEGRDVGRLAGL